MPSLLKHQWLPVASDHYWIAVALLFTEINLVRSQSVALPSEPSADLAAHLPFSDVGDPRPAGKKPAATPLGKPIVGQISRKCYPVDRGEHDSGAQTLRHLRSRTGQKQPRLTSSQTWRRLVQRTHIFSHIPFQTLDRPKTTSAPKFRNEDQNYSQSNPISTAEKHHHV